MTIEGKESRDPRQDGIRNWLRQNYFVPRYGDQAFAAKGPTTLARVILGLDTDPKHEPNLKAMLSEALFAKVVQHFMPGYGIYLSTKELDAQGCDLTVQNENGVIGGIDVTNNQSLTHLKARRISTPFPVIVLWTRPDNLGAKKLLHTLQEGATPVLEDFVEMRLQERQGLHALRVIPHQIDTFLKSGRGTPEFNEGITEFRNNLDQYLTVE